MSSNIASKKNSKINSVFKTIPLRPVISEKSYSLSQNNVYVFKVPINTNSDSIKKSVSEQFSVKVIAVRTLVQNGKPKRTIKKRQRAGNGSRSNYKKAYVTVDKANKINLFGEDEKEAKKAKAAEKASSDKVISDNKVKKKSGLRNAFSRGSRQVQDRGGEK